MPRPPPDSPYFGAMLRSLPVSNKVSVTGADPAVGSPAMAGPMPNAYPPGPVAPQASMGNVVGGGVGTSMGTSPAVDGSVKFGGVASAMAALTPTATATFSDENTKVPGFETDAADTFKLDMPKIKEEKKPEPAEESSSGMGGMMGMAGGAMGGGSGGGMMGMMSDEDAKKPGPFVGNQKLGHEVVANIQGNPAIEKVVYPAKAKFRNDEEGMQGYLPQGPKMPEAKAKKPVEKDEPDHRFSHYELMQFAKHILRTTPGIISDALAKQPVKQATETAAPAVGHAADMQFDDHVDKLKRFYGGEDVRMDDPKPKAPAVSPVNPSTKTHEDWQKHVVDLRNKFANTKAAVTSDELAKKAYAKAEAKATEMWEDDRNPLAPTKFYHKFHGAKKEESGGSISHDQSHVITRPAMGVVGYELAPTSSHPYVTSDQHAKQPSPHAQMGQAGQNIAGQFLHSIHPEAYQYKDPKFSPNQADGNKQQLGIFAQQALRTPVGSTLVKKDPATGMLQLQVPQLVNALAAGEGELQRQVDELKGKLKLKK